MVCFENIKRVQIFEDKFLIIYKVQTFIYLFTYLFIYLFVCLFVYLLLYLFTYLFIHFPIHSFTHLFTHLIIHWLNDGKCINYYKLFYVCSFSVIADDFLFHIRVSTKLSFPLFFERIVTLHMISCAASLLEYPFDR